MPFLVNSSLDVSVFSASPTPGTSILTRGLQTVVNISAPTEVPANDTTSQILYFLLNKSRPNFTFPLTDVMRSPSEARLSRERRDGRGGGGWFVRAAVP